MLDPHFQTFTSRTRHILSFKVYPRNEQLSWRGHPFLEEKNIISLTSIRAEFIEFRWMIIPSRPQYMHLVQKVHKKEHFIFSSLSLYAQFTLSIEWMSLDDHQHTQIPHSHTLNSSGAIQCAPKILWPKTDKRNKNHRIKKELKYKRLYENHNFTLSNHLNQEDSNVQFILGLPVVDFFFQLGS